MILNNKLIKMLELPKADVKVFNFINDYEPIIPSEDYIPLDATDIADGLKLNITTVQRALKRLYDLNMIIRSKQNLGGGGYVFLYYKQAEFIIKKAIKDEFMRLLA